MTELGAKSNFVDEDSNVLERTRSVNGGMKKRYVDLILWLCG
jgi:hypothetical protein